MKSNPQVCYYRNGYCIRFIRNSGKVLIWVQDLSGPKMKSTIVNLPVIEYSSKEEAENIAKNIVIPYLLKEKDVDHEEIFGW